MFSADSGLKVWLATNGLQFSRCKTLEIFTIKKLTEPLKTPPQRGVRQRVREKSGKRRKGRNKREERSEEGRNGERRNE